MQKHSGSKARKSEGQKEATAAGAQETASTVSDDLGQERRVANLVKGLDAA